MAVTLEEIGKFLDNLEITYQKEEDVIMFGISNDDEHAMVFVRAKEDGELFDLQMEPLDENHEAFDLPKESKHMQKILAHMLYMNYKAKFGSWEYDPSDGDIRFSIEIPLEDATMTQNQLTRIISMLNTQTGQIKQIKTLLETGELPEDDSDDKTMKELLEMLLSGMEEEEDSKEDKKDKEDDEEDGI